MESDANILVIVYFNGSIIRTIEEGVAFVCDKPICFTIPQTMSLICGTQGWTLSRHKCQHPEKCVKNKI